jgi:hypothetical protein
LAITAALHPINGPKRAVRYVASQHDADRTPAILWLTVALIVLWSLRNGRLPQAGEALIAALGVGLLVLAGSVAPRLVFWLLLALVVAASLGASPQLIAFLEQLRAKGGATLSGGG